jgi:hypothetical protein
MAPRKNNYRTLTRPIKPDNGAPKTRQCAGLNNEMAIERARSKLPDGIYYDWHIGKDEVGQSQSNSEKFSSNVRDSVSGK